MPTTTQLLKGLIMGAGGRVTVLEILKDVPMYELKRVVRGGDGVKKAVDAGADAEVARELKKIFMASKKDLKIGEGLTEASRVFMKKVSGIFAKSKAMNTAGANTHAAMLGIFIGVGQMKEAGGVVREIEKSGMKKNKDYYAMLIKYHTKRNDLAAGVAAYHEAGPIIHGSLNAHRAMLQHLVALGEPKRAVEFFDATLSADERSLALLLPVAKTSRDVESLIEKFENTNPSINPYNRPELVKTLLKISYKNGFDPPPRAGGPLLNNDSEAALFGLKKYSKTSDFPGMLCFLQSLTKKNHPVTGQGYASVIFICLKTTKTIGDEPYVTAQLAYEQAIVGGYLPSAAMIHVNMLKIHMKYNQVAQVTAVLDRAAQNGILVKSLHGVKKMLVEMYHKEGVAPPACLTTRSIMKHF